MEAHCHRAPNPQWRDVQIKGHLLSPLPFMLLLWNNGSMTSYKVVDLFDVVCGLGQERNSSRISKSKHKSLKQQNILLMQM